LEVECAEEAGEGWRRGDLGLVFGWLVGVVVVEKKREVINGKGGVYIFCICVNSALPAYERREGKIWEGIWELISLIPYGSAEKRKKLIKIKSVYP